MRGRPRLMMGMAGAAAVTLALVIVAVVWPSSASSQRDAGALGAARPVVGAPVATFDSDLGDPFLLVVAHPASAAGTRYLLFGTDDPPRRVPTAFSDDLQHWKQGGDALPDLPSWALPDPDDSHTWAPAVVAIGRRYLMYVSVYDAAIRRPCLLAATATTPIGPFRDAIGRPLVCQSSLGGSIDPSVVTATDGSRTLLWRSAGATTLFSQRLRPDGLALVGQPHVLLRPDREWQHGVIEEPAAIPAPRGGWWLFYSGGAYNQAGYATGVAFCPTLDGPCSDTDNGPLLDALPGQLSNPASLETFHDLHGRLYAVYDTWSRPARNGIFFCCRTVSIAPLR
ncbi:MAG: family 43 glycosylhydrolase [Frankia sp.]